jgi:hypothetical protein
MRDGAARRWIAIDTRHDNLRSRLNEFLIRDNIHSLAFDIRNTGRAQRRNGGAALP